MESGIRIRFDWGLDGLRNLRTSGQAVVVVDALSFSTCVSIAVDQGAELFPYRFHHQRARAYAESFHAHLAGPRGSGSRFSLSPQSMFDLAYRDRLVLPSPNGSAISFEAQTGMVLAGCFRNAGAVAAFLNQTQTEICVIAAGERWPNGNPRFAIEDLLAAGSIISRLEGTKSNEAALAAETFRIHSHKVETMVMGSLSGRELIGRGFPADVELACEIDVSDGVPLLAWPRFIKAGKPVEAATI